MRGALLFAFNNATINYYDMAVATARRINHFLKLPVSIVTDPGSVTAKSDYTFDRVILVEPDKTNSRGQKVWINKGRFQAFDLSPYDETLLLDTDYLVNSSKLNTIFDFYDDFCCHNQTCFLLEPEILQEVLSVYSMPTLWATVIAFKKTKRVEQIFQCMKMVQQNYEHYSNIHSFMFGMFRNDYALTLALRIVNGHTSDPRDFIPWNLLHVGKNIRVGRDEPGEFNTAYSLLVDKQQRGKTKTEYISTVDCDFHMLNKFNFMEII